MPIYRQDSGICGAILINKPQGFTSFDVIAKLRGILKTRRLGHTGTLDPLATGLLIVLAGRATCAADLLPGDKSYVASFKLGLTTDSQDITGSIISSFDGTFPDNTTLEDHLKQFFGDISQIPPMYSAIKINGQKLYNLARKGIEVERTPRQVHILELSLLEYNQSDGEGKIFLTCTKGTYVRTLIHDFGQSVQCGAVMTSLTRTHACGFSLENAYSLEQISKIDPFNYQDFSQFIVPLDLIFSSFPRIYLNNNQVPLFKNGVKLSLSSLNLPKIEPYSQYSNYIAVWDEKQNFLGIAYPNNETNVLRIVKNFSPAIV